MGQKESVLKGQLGAKMRKFTCTECGKKYKVKLNVTKGICPDCFKQLLGMKDFRGHDVKGRQAKTRRERLR